VYVDIFSAFKFCGKLPKRIEKYRTKCRDNIQAKLDASMYVPAHYEKLLSDGQHTVIASATDAAGNTGTASLTFMLDTTPPIGQITSDTLNKNNSFTISGTSEKGAAVKIF
jgi:Bacterial Ig-like domain